MRALAIVAVVACSPAPSGAPAPTPTPSRPKSASVVDTNIARADYIGPTACADCHAVQHALWSASLHRVMNARVEDPGALVGDFKGAVLRYAGGEVRFDRDLAGATMTTRKGDRTVRYRVTRTIGRRGLQEYVGIEDGHTDEVRLPFGWWPRAGGWVAQPAFDPWLEEASFDAFARVREPWAERCPWCHSTYPFAQRIARATERAVGHGFEQYFTSAPGSQRLAVDEQVTTGISCESCHLGGRAHAAGGPISLVPVGAAPRPNAPAFPTTFAEQRNDARVINTVCAQCHSGPSPRLADGTALRNSSEALDLAASACVGIKCTDCHDPHVADSRGDDARSIETCGRCHETQRDPVHAGPGHAGVSCLDCHMPRIVMGIDRYVRTHRISSPTNAALYAEAAPNACNLCHLDRPIEWTLAELRAGWDVRIAPALAAYGDDNVGDVWLASKSPAVRLIAAQAYARSPLGKFVVDKLRARLVDPQAYVREWTRFAIEEIIKRR